MSDAQPTLARRAFGARIRRLREERGLVHREVAEAIGYKRDAIRRMENGEHGIKLPVAKALCEFFGIEGAEKSHMCNLAVKSNERGWWEPFVDKTTGRRPSSRGFPLFLETEQDANFIRILETEVVPGLLQTTEYMTELSGAAIVDPENPVTELHEVRGARQERLFERAPAPKLEFILGPAIFVYLDAMPSRVREGQLARLEEVDALPTAEIRVLTSLHAGASGSFNILTPGDGGPPWVALEAADGLRYVEYPAVVTKFERIFAAAKEKTGPLKEYLR